MRRTIAVLLLLGLLRSAGQTEETTTVELDPLDLRGLRIRDGDLDLRLGGRLAFDLIRYDRANDRDVGLEVDDALLRLDVGWRSLLGRLEVDLLGSDTPANLREAWIAWEPDSALRLSAGLLKVALGTERATRDEHRPGIREAFPSQLSGRYDLGLRVEGEPWPGLWGEATVTAGAGFGHEGHRLRSPLLGLRAVVHPFECWEGGRHLLGGRLRGFYLGASYAVLGSFDDRVVLTTPLESVVFRTRRLDGVGGHWRVIEGGWRAGPLRLGWENTVGSADDVPVGGGREKDMDQLGSWSLLVSVLLTGEEATWSRGRWTEPRIPAAGTSRWAGLPLPGRWELSGRYANADIDRRLFGNGLATYDPSTQEVRTVDLLLTCVPREGLRLGLGWVKTIADHELTTFGGRNRDSSFLLHVELNL